MNRTIKRAILAVVLLAAAPAYAAEPGLAELKAQVARAARENPNSFQALARTKRSVPSLDEKRRGPIAVVAPLLKAQGPQALWPLIAEVLDGASSKDFRPAARTAWAVGVLEALAALGDTRCAPAVRLALQSETEPEVIRAAAAALGRVDPEADKVLLPLAMNAGPRQLPVVSGLGEARSVKAVVALSELLAKTNDEPLSRAAARSLGVAGSSWVWQTPSYASRPEREAVQQAAARGLLAAFVARSGELRRAAESALLIVDWPGTPGLIEKAKADAPAQAAELDRLADRFAHSPLRPAAR